MFIKIYLCLSQTDMLKSKITNRNNSKSIMLDTFTLYLVIAINALHTSYYIPVQKSKCIDMFVGMQ